MTPLFIASKRVEHDGSRSTIAAGSLIGAHAHVRLAPGYGFIQGAEMLADTLLAMRGGPATADAEVGIEQVKRAGMEAWRIHHGGRDDG